MPGQVLNHDDSVVGRHNQGLVVIVEELRPQWIRLLRLAGKMPHHQPGQARQAGCQKQKHQSTASASARAEVAQNGAQEPGLIPEVHRRYPAPAHEAIPENDREVKRGTYFPRGILTLSSSSLPSS